MMNMYMIKGSVHSRSKDLSKSGIKVHFTRRSRCFSPDRRIVSAFHTPEDFIRSTDSTSQRDPSPGIVQRQMIITSNSTSHRDYSSSYNYGVRSPKSKSHRRDISTSKSHRDYSSSFNQGVRPPKSKSHRRDISTSKPHRESSSNFNQGVRSPKSKSHKIGP